jgi:hypothetical protein
VGLPSKGRAAAARFASVTFRTTVDVLPAASVATTVMTFAPSASPTAVENAPEPSSDIGTPFTVTPNAVASVAEPVTVTLLAKVVELSGGAVTFNEGAVLSRTTVRTIVDVWPSASVATKVMLFAPGASGTMSWKNPSPVSACGRPFAVTVTAVKSDTGPRVNSLDACVTSPMIGWKTSKLGGCVSRVIVRVESVRLPFASIAVIVSVFCPHCRAVRSWRTRRRRRAARSCH